MVTRLLPLAFCLLLVACATAPVQTLPPAEVMPLSVQSTLVIAQATALAGQVAQATESRRITEQAVSDAQTATAFPFAMVATQAAATATTQIQSITQTAIISANEIALSQTAVARIDAASTRTAGYQAEQTRAAEDASLQQWREAGSRFTALASTSALGMFWLFVIIMFAIAVSLGLMFARWMWRPRVIGDRLMLPTATGWTDITPRMLIAAPVEQPPTRDLTAEAAYYSQFSRAILDAATLAGIVGGWSVSLMCEQFPSNARPISEDDRERIVSILAKGGVLVAGRGNRGTDYGQGENFMTLKDAVESGDLEIPPYSEGAPPPPKVDVSLAPRNATQRNATQTIQSSPLKRSKVTQ